MILNVEGSIHEETVLNVKLQTPFTAKNWIRLKYDHLPPLPLHNGFDDAVSWGSTSLNIPAFSSIEELVGILNAMRDDQNNPLMHVFYDGREFELCVEDTYGLTPAIGDSNVSNRCLLRFGFVERSFKDFFALERIC